jgi:hypothetical protein
VRIDWPVNKSPEKWDLRYRRSQGNHQASRGGADRKGVPSVTEGAGPFGKNLQERATHQMVAHLEGEFAFGTPFTQESAEQNLQEVGEDHHLVAQKAIG